MIESVGLARQSAAFSGMGAWSQPFRDAGHETFRIELNAVLDADAHIDDAATASVVAAAPGISPRRAHPAPGVHDDDDGPQLDLRG